MGAAPPARQTSSESTRLLGRTRIGAFWVAVVVSLVVLVLLIIFIIENGRHARVAYFGAHADLPLGVALLIAAVIGGLVVAFAGAARILQVRARARRAARAVASTTAAPLRSSP